MPSICSFELLFLNHSVVEKIINIADTTLGKFTKAYFLGKIYLICEGLNFIDFISIKCYRLW